MTWYWKALYWTLPILAAAFAGRFGLIGPDTAQTLWMVLPIAAWLALQGEPACRLRRRKAAA